jgi:hypothetical protein
VAAAVAARGTPARGVVGHGVGEHNRQPAPGSSSASGMHAIATAAAAEAHGPAAGVRGGKEDGGRAGMHDHQPRQASGEARGGASTALPLAPPTGQVVKQLDGSIAELLGDVQMPYKVMVRCSVNEEMQPGTQQVGVCMRYCM